MATNSTAMPPVSSDLWEDLRWKSPHATVEEYLEKPWDHCQDPQQAYLGTRFNTRNEFLGNLDPEARVKIQHELGRIEKVRRRFPTDEKKQALVDNLKVTLHEWRRCVRDNKKAMTDEIHEESLLRGYTTQRQEREYGTLGRFHATVSVAAGVPGQSAVIHGRSRHRPSFPKLGKARGPKIGAHQASKGNSIPEELEDEKVDEPEPLYGLKASAMYFKRVDGEESAWSGWTHDHKGYGGSKFPNQKIAMHKILENTENNPLMEQCPENCIRYFHFPTNNMLWIEKAIARYYNETPQPLDDRHHTYSPNGRKTEKLLSREFWRGQMHGSSAYGSNMRSQLGNAVYPAEDWARKGGPIHARHMRSKCAVIPRDTGTNETHNHENNAAVAVDGQTVSKNITLPERISPKGKNVALFLPYMHWETSSRRAKMVQVINETIGHKKKEPALRNVTKKIMATNMSKVKTESKPWRRLLATYLLTLAQVAEQMDYEADERLLRDYVKADPPLHIRRTLDQYYFVTLDDTSQRDRDQVVYRDTIITSFPRRWGRNKPDPSGVHKSLRERFEARPEDIKSVQHLAFMIIDQCSRVFFDRTKPLDQRPEVMDIFASAIAHVDQMTAVAYDTFWRHTKLYNKNMLPKTIGTKYLDINPEGALLKEAQDIAEELKMMKRIYNEQLKVVKDFKRHLVHPQGRRADKADSAHQLQKLIQGLIDSREKQDESSDEDQHNGAETSKGQKSQPTIQIADETLHEAEGVLELVKSRRAEIVELEQSAMHTCRQLEGFLTLKQQQASIVEAKAALERAEESVKQGRAIMAFTIVTIFFLPLGFFAAFFGMNNDDINEAKWMTLNDQIQYMFSLSTVVIVLSTSIAFYPTMKPFLAPIIKPSLVVYDILRALYNIVANSNSQTSKRRETKKLLREVQRRMDKKEAVLRAPPNLQKEQENLGEPQSTVKFMEILAWLPKGRIIERFMDLTQSFVSGLERRGWAFWARILHAAPRVPSNRTTVMMRKDGAHWLASAIPIQFFQARQAGTMHLLNSLAVFVLSMSPVALAAIIDPELQPRTTTAAPEPTSTDPCAPDPFCDPAWPEGSVSVLTDTAAGVCTPVISTRFHSHVCGRTTWTTSTTVTSTADCGVCGVGTLAPLSATYYAPRCPHGGHYTVSTAKVASTRTTWECSATGGP
ncbi:hypothetical protein PG993_012463 [Apiospora rasikravindrae]|uniref:Ankyrin repeat protein n=1 Tax=Apiospora rasikravindrae TaxID=990691 RepID=A0ABR1S3U8_9PEZI